MQKIDATRLIGGHSFRVPCNLNFNGYNVTNLSALPDTGADGFAFINHTCAVSVASFLGVKAVKLPRPIYPKGYGGQRATHPITHFICFDLIVDSRKPLRIPFLILELGSADIILGMKWLAYFNLKVDATNERLIWPESIPPGYNRSFAKQLHCPYRQLDRRTPLRAHQNDVHARDTAFEAEDRRRAAGRASSSSLLAIAGLSQIIHEPARAAQPYPPPTSDIRIQALQKSLLSDEVPVSNKGLYLKDIRRRMRAMEAQLAAASVDSSAPEPPRVRKYKYAPLEKPLPDLKIAEISAVAFHLNLRRSSNTLFSVTLNELDRELDSRNPKTSDDLTDVLAKLPDKYVP